MNCNDFEHMVFRLNSTDIEIKFKLDKILLVLNTNRFDFHMEYIKVKEKNTSNFHLPGNKKRDILAKHFPLKTVMTRHIF